MHVGIQGADRAIAICDHLRAALPPLLALSANSPFLDGRDTGLASVRTQIFTRSFPRCGVHEPFGDFATYAEFIDLLARTESAVEATQLWWSVRPITSSAPSSCGSATPRPAATTASTSPRLITACIAQAALDYDDGRLGAPMRGREIEENLWRAIRFGLDGTQIDFAAGEAIPTRLALERLLDWTAPARDALGLDAELPETNGTQRARELLERGRRSSTSTVTQWPRRADVRARGLRRQRRLLRIGVRGEYSATRLSDRDPEPGAPGATPASEEELQRRLEEQMRQVRVQDLLLESLASILNLSARRIAKEDERDLEQARIGIEAVRALLDLVEPEAASRCERRWRRCRCCTRASPRPRRGGRPLAGRGAAAGGRGDQPGAEPPPAPEPGPADGKEPPPRLWTPHSRS